MKNFDKNCLTCKCWNGDREKTWDTIKKHGSMVMDKDWGYPESGTCKMFSDFAELEIEGNAWAQVVFEGSFGCIYHKRL